MTAAVALPVPRTDAATLDGSYASRTHVACGAHGGDVWAAAVCAGVDRQQGIAFYAVRVANNSELTLHARMRAVRSAPPLLTELTIAPFSILETLVPIRGNPPANGERACIDVTGPGVAFSIDAPVPAFLCRPAAGLALPLPSSRAVAAALGLLVLLILVVATALFARPPGVRSVVSRPAKAVAHAPVVRRAATPDSTPLLDELTVSPLPARAGAALRVAYATAATAGDVWLLDAQGQVWAHTGIDRSGTTWLHVPAAAAGRAMRVVVHATRGGAHAQMAAGILVLPDDANVADAGSGASEAQAVAAASGVVVSPMRAIAGHPIHVTLGGSRGEALVSLTDGSGAVVQEVDVPAGRNGITLIAPSVSAAATYDVVVSVSHGVSEESIVRPVVVVP